MAANVMWWGSIALEGAVLFRGYRAAILKKYPLFYTYIGCIFLIELLRLACYEWGPGFYQAFYWYTELVPVVASYGIIVEIFRKALQHNPGFARVAKKLLLVVFVMSISFAASDLVHGGFASVLRATADLGRDLRYVEGGLLLLMLCLFVRYRIPFGLTLLGLTLGYSLWVGIDVANLALLSFPGNEFSIVLRNSLSITYFLTLLAWCATLWSAHPDPVPPAESAIDLDYLLLAERTRASFAALSGVWRRLLP